MSNQAGTLYVVATPIGNLGDITARALEVLGTVALIVAEDTRHSGHLLRHFGIHTPSLALHEHNEAAQVGGLIERLTHGESLALISDAGTPLISDPGFHLVREARRQNIPVVPVPGASALIAALSVSGLPSDRFVFEGFLPARAEARCKHLTALREEPRTLIFYEAPHRIQETLEDLGTAFGAERQAVIARELTKTFETVLADSLGELARRVRHDADQRKGEFVLLVHGAAELEREKVEVDTQQVLKILLDELPLKQAAALAARICGLKKNAAYDLALALQRQGEAD